MCSGGLTDKREGKEGREGGREGGREEKRRKEKEQTERGSMCPCMCVYVYLYPNTLAYSRRIFKNNTLQVRLTATAVCNGVEPVLLRESTCAPDASKVIRHPSLCRRAMIYSGDSPSLFFASISAPQLNSSSTDWNKVQTSKTTSNSLNQKRK